MIGPCAQSEVINALFIRQLIARAGWGWGLWMGAGELSATGEIRDLDRNGTAKNGLLRKLYN